MNKSSAVLLVVLALLAIAPLVEVSWARVTHAPASVVQDPKRDWVTPVHLAYSGFESGNFWDDGGLNTSFTNSYYYYNYNAPAGSDHLGATIDYVTPRSGSYMYETTVEGKRQQVMFGTSGVGGSWYWELFWSFWMYVPSDFNMWGAMRFNQLWELREGYSDYAGGSSGSLNVWLYQPAESADSLYWNFWYGRVPKITLRRKFDFSVNATDGWHGAMEAIDTDTPSTIEYTPHEVPLGRWFRLEIYVRRHTSEGIFKVWITDPQHPDPAKRDCETLFHVWNVMTKCDMLEKTDWDGARVETFKLYPRDGDDYLPHVWYFDDCYVYNYNAHQVFPSRRAPYSDIRQAKIALVDMHTCVHEVEELDNKDEDRAYMRVSMVIGGKPPKTPSESYLGYVWHFDLDGDGDFSDFPGDVNARVFWDGNGWHAFLDGVDFTGIPFMYTITGRHVTFTFPLSSLNNPTSFSWFGMTYQIDASNNLVATDPTSTATWSSH